MIIGVDIDGVLFPWADVANEALARKYGYKLGPHTSWGYLKEMVSDEAWAWLWSAEGQADVFGRDACYPDAVAAVNALLRAGHSVHFVTHRDPRLTAVHTAAFLARHFGSHPWAGVHIVGGDVAKRKLQRWDVFVDDKPETVFDFLGNTGAVVFSPVRPWNVDALEGIGAEDGIIRYTNPAAIVEWVEAHS